MPLCPKCKVTVGMWERGLICPECMRLYSFDEARDFEGFDIVEVCLAKDLMDELMGFGLLGPGGNRVEFFEDGVIINKLDDIF